MLRERMREMDIKVTELSDYLKISRPTMYKFIDYYEAGQFDLINKNVLKLFNFISENDLAGKKSVIAFILNHLIEVKPLGEKTEISEMNRIRKYIVENPESKKSIFLKLCASTDFFDDLIYILPDVFAISQKNKKDENEQRFLDLYTSFLENLKSNLNKDE